MNRSGQIRWESAIFLLLNMVCIGAFLFRLKLPKGNGILQMEKNKDHVKLESGGRKGLHLLNAAKKWRTR